MAIDFRAIEKKWQKKWEEEEIFHTLDFVKDKEKFYVLEMFPYPSGSGLHMGHALNYTIGDIYARFKRMQGFNVLYPMGYDAFGLPAENAAIQAGEHPKEYTENSIRNFIAQQKALGLSYDWSRKITTSEPEYYRWNQFLFLKFFEKGLVYRKAAPVNWCDKCGSVLANEQVHDGKCWRHRETAVGTKHLEQWFIKTSKYADELLDCLGDLKWPERIKTMQKNWIGKSYGAEILFEVALPGGKGKENWKVFTTRPDTIFGVTFMVVSAQHPRLMELVGDSEKPKVEEFLKQLNSVSEKELDKIDKEGVFTGSYAINPANNEKIPVYAGNFVLADYGSGMVMAVPAHDQRDFEFAAKYNLPVKIVIKPREFEIYERKGRISEAYTEEGYLVNSGQFNDMDSEKAKHEITKFLEKKKLAKKSVQYKFRDWLISRQRYWGTPIPVVYCKKCGIVPVPKESLPVALPEKVDFGEGNPLLTNKEWINTKCPKCRAEAKRETDTMDTFFDSSWYFLRYCDSDNSSEPFSKNKIKYWMPVNQYIGGAEHACMHLIYARFFAKALRDFGFLEFGEPFSKLFNQGMLHGSDGYVMSKSRGNAVNPLEIIEKYGADSLRLALMSFASPDKDTNWDEKILVSSHKFLNKAADFFENTKIGESDAKTESKLNKTIKQVAEDIENFKYNMAIIKIRELFDSFSERESKEVLEKSLKLLHPFCPHITEEFWKKIGNSTFISLSKWPEAEEKKISEFFDRQDEATNKIVSDIANIIKIVEAKGWDASKIYIYALPGEKDIYNMNELKKRINKKIEIFGVSDKNKYDPKGISKKAKPGKPGIYVE